ncbi:hypothetical protein [Escherichia phage phiWec193]|uniref:Uncharacterized protein n=1 Tax=Escherichia phage phiWec193 TaxID=2992788 RepID=A0ACA8SAS4_9CAUD|nr:hypothetical protein [Escherichia phage phiWec193]BDU14490.1 hypothetical protein [Escherichia phage phiWec196]
MSNNIRVINFKKEEKIAVLLDGQEIFKGDYEDHQTAISITRVIGYHNFYPQQRLNESKRL